MKNVIQHLEKHGFSQATRFQKGKSIVTAKVKVLNDWTSTWIDVRVWMSFTLTSERLCKVSHSKLICKKQQVGIRRAF